MYLLRCTAFGISLLGSDNWKDSFDCVVLYGFCGNKHKDSVKY